MCAALADLAPQIRTVGGQPHRGETIILCNGIETSFEDALSKGRGISQMYGGRQVVVFHNPTSAAGYLLAYYTTDPAALREQGVLSRALKELIQSRIQEHQKNPEVDKTAIRIILFVHSHGARVAFGALHALGEAEKQKIYVYAFGGAVLIPKNFARVARNYFLAGDSIAGKANGKDLNPNLERHLNIHERIRRAPAEMTAAEKQARAIFNRTCEELALEDITLRNAPREEFERDSKFSPRKKQIEECFATYQVIAMEPHDIPADLKGFNRAETIHGMGTYFNEYLAGIRAETT
jgi:hypothetical protein